MEVEGSNLMAASLESVATGDILLVEVVMVVAGGIFQVEVVRGILLVEVVMVVEDLDCMASTSLHSVQEQWCHQASLNLSLELEPQHKETNLTA